LYIGGQRITASVSNTDSASTIAAALATAIGKHASGTLTFASAQAADTFAVGGVTFTAVSGTPSTDQFDVSGSDSAAATSAKAAILANATTKALVHAEPSSGVLTLRGRDRRKFDRSRVVEQQSDREERSHSCGGDRRQRLRGSRQRFEWRGHAPRDERGRSRERD
jgi:hypothetical protein